MVAPIIAQRGHAFLSQSSEALRRISLVSYNMLAQPYFESWKDTFYKFAPRQLLDWEFRKSLFVSEIEKSLQADILCFQEVVRDSFFLDFQPWFSKQDYQCIVQNPKKQRKGREVGNAILFKESLFELVREESRSRCLIVALRYKPTRQVIYLCNMHLEGHPSLEDKRFEQLISSVKSIERLQRLIEPDLPLEKMPVILCGDFNSEPDRNLYRFLKSGEVKKSQKDVPFYPDVELYNRDYKLPFKFQCSSDFESINGNESDCGISQTFESSFYLNTMQQSRVDFIWFSSASIQEISSMQVLPEEDKPSILEHGLPSEKYASDHMAIGSILQMI